MMKPQRKCIGCNQSYDKDTLYRIVAKEGELVIDHKQQMPGRGCYLCKNEQCLEKALKRKSFSRALKQDISSEALGRCFNDR